MSDWWCPEPWLRFAPIFGEKIEAAIDGARIGYYEDSYWCVARGKPLFSGAITRNDDHLPTIISLTSNVGLIRLNNVIYYMKNEQFMTFGELSFGNHWNRYSIAEISECVTSPIEIYPDNVKMDSVTRFLLIEKTGGF